MATKTFAEFFETLEDAYAMDINDYVGLYPIEIEEDDDGAPMLTIYSEEGNFQISSLKNEAVEFNEEARAFVLTAFDSLYEEDRLITIRPLVLI